MSYFLYLDDEVFLSNGYRKPENYYKQIGEPDILDTWEMYKAVDKVVQVSNVEDAISYIEKNGCPEFISFDNDLQREKEGKHLAFWLVEKDMDNPGFIPSGFNYFVHSQNIEAKKTIYSYLNQYLTQVLNQKKLKY